MVLPYRRERGWTSDEASQIRKLAAGGSLTASDLVRREDSDSWRKAGTIKGLFTPQKPADKVTTKPRKRDQGVNPYLYEQVLQARRIARVWVFFGSVAMLGVINIAPQGENAKTKIAPFGYFLAMVFFAVVPWGLWFFQRCGAGLWHRSGISLHSYDRLPDWHVHRSLGTSGVSRKPLRASTIQNSALVWSRVPRRYA